MECIIESPVGNLLLRETGLGISEIAFTEQTVRWNDGRFFKQAADQLGEYFSGKRTVFDLPLDMKGTVFQKQVWEALCRIPFGETRSYQEIACGIGRPKAVRAVGMACHVNPVVIAVPCHRVIGKNGSLTGFGGGLDRKSFLLNFERMNMDLRNSDS
ncbi:MAG: methylated-DNA--[protein]-cysteine S-methyltransferase [Erysipelotrichaceae bacterium]|nr:methylated-DNA--[protein]-cysteine S-methyltransferase [Erysipelotrichaceae bacterium]